MTKCIDNTVKVAIVTELRDSIEIVQSVEYPRFLALLMPSFTHILLVTPISFQSDSNEHVELFSLSCIKFMDRNYEILSWKLFIDFLIMKLSNHMHMS